MLDLTDPDPREFEAARIFAEHCLMTGYKQLGTDILYKLFGYDTCQIAYVVTMVHETLGPYSVKVAEKLQKELEVISQIEIVTPEKNIVEYFV